MSGNSGTGSEQERMERVRAVKEAHEEKLMSCANVVGVGVGLMERGGQHPDDVGSVVMVSRKVPRSQLAAEDVIPRELDGVPVDVKEVGEVRVQ